MMVTKETIQSITPEMVVNAYTGKARTCRCGCAGKYFTSPAMRATAEEGRGYSYEDEFVSLEQVTKILRTIQANEEIAEVQDGYIVSIDLGKATRTRNNVKTYTIYLEQE